MQNLQKLLISSIIFNIKIYQIIFSPKRGILGGLFFFGNCRFYPCCSDYSIRTLRQYGLLVGLMASLKRIIKCNPWNSGGYDPIE